MILHALTGLLRLFGLFRLFAYCFCRTSHSSLTREMTATLVAWFNSSSSAFWVKQSRIRHCCLSLPEVAFLRQRVSRLVARWGIGRRESIMAENSYDLVIVGAGSGNMLPAKEFADWRIAVVESDRFGGTCLNRGCIPSKILVHTADVAQEVRHAGRFGIGAKWLGADWPAIRERVFNRIDPVHERAVAYRRGKGNDVFIGEARFVAPKVLKVGDVEIRGEQFVLATGSRPSVPPINGLADVPYVTSDTVMRLPKLPRSMIVLGGGYIAAEMSHIFGSLGTRVTIVTRRETMLARHDADIRARFTELYRDRFDLRLGATVDRVAATRKGIRLSLSTAQGAQDAEGEVLLVA